MQFPSILGGFETRQKQFFAYFLSQEKNQKKNSRKNWFFSGENRFLSEKSAIFRRFFFSEFSTAKSFLGPPKSYFSPKNRPISVIFLSLFSSPNRYHLRYFITIRNLISPMKHSSMVKDMTIRRKWVRLKFL